MGSGEFSGMIDMRPTYARDCRTAGQRFWDSNPCGGNWKSYADFLTWIQRTEPYAFQIMGQYDWAGKRVLDVGCGQGTLLNYLSRYGATMFGVDMSISSLCRASTGATELGLSSLVHIAAANAERLPFPAAVFEAVVCFGVLHHTSDTQAGVKELWRILKPGGVAIVMLYRSGNPKWWATRLIRSFSFWMDGILRKDQPFAERIRKKQGIDDVRGTALLELFGVPILKAFSNRQARKMFAMFSKVEISNHQPGFERLADIVKGFGLIKKLLQRLDRRFKNIWGFYQVIQVVK